MSRLTISLPAPPAKRHKFLQPVPVHQLQPTAAETDHFDELHHQVLSAPEAEAPEPALPNDTLLALQLLKSRFPAQAKAVPFATRAQLYNVLSDRTAIDRQLEELRRANTIRLLQLPTSRDEHAVMLTAEYCAALRRCQQEAAEPQQGQQEQAGGAAAWEGAAEGDGARGGAQQQPAAATAAAAAAAAAAQATAQAAAEVFGWFATRVLPACTELMITHAELVQLLAGGSLAGRSLAGNSLASSSCRKGPGGPTSSGGRAGASRDQLPPGRQQPLSEHQVSLLLNRGFLTRHTGGPDGYLFSMPAAGAAVRSVAAGRAEIQSLLQRRRHPEILESELTKRKLQRSVLGVSWHVSDMLGAGALLRIPTSVGPLLRLAKRGG